MPHSSLCDRSLRPHEVLLSTESFSFSLWYSEFRVNPFSSGPVIENIPDIPGIDAVTKYSQYVPGEERYRNKRVLIIGGGNSAFETANELAGRSAIIHIAIRRPVRHAWDSHFVGDLRAVNNDIIDMYQLKVFTVI